MTFSVSLFLSLLLLLICYQWSVPVTPLLRGVNMALKKKFKCEVCPYAASTKQHLQRHLKGVHEKSKPYKCQSVLMQLLKGEP